MTGQEVSVLVASVGAPEPVYQRDSRTDSNRQHPPNLLAPDRFAYAGWAILDLPTV